MKAYTVNSRYYLPTGVSTKDKPIAVFLTEQEAEERISEMALESTRKGYNVRKVSEWFFQVRNHSAILAEFWIEDRELI